MTDTIFTQTMCQRCRQIVFAIDSRMLCLGCQIIADLTIPQRETLKAVRSLVSTSSPVTVKTVADLMEIPQSTVYARLLRLKQKRYVTWRHNAPGTIRLTDRRIQ